MRGALQPSWSTGVLPMPFLAFLLGEPGLQRWASPCPGPLGRWDAHPSPISAGCPFTSAWWAHRCPRELLSLPLPRSSFPDGAGGVILLEVLFPQTLPSCGFTPPMLLPIHHTFYPGPGLFTSTPGSRACFHLRDPLVSEEGALGFSGCFLFSCVTLSPLPQG